ncbi:MAG: GntR family transcriptional regulator [Terrimicrobiaceae bacterium]|nr:GntR family transcriptional regulator [Terrimicrobiaceae bacterium]
MLIKQQPLHQQVEDFVRTQIVEGVFAPGSRMPSTGALAKQMGTSVRTVHMAMARLHSEGLLDRRDKRATYVRGVAPVHTCAGIYLNGLFWRDDSDFYRAVGLELQRKLAVQGVKSLIWSDDRPENEQKVMLPSLKRAIERREIQSLIAPLIREGDPDWILNARIPSAMLTMDRSLKNGYCSDPGQIMRTGLEQLRLQGCRSVGIISHIGTSQSQDLDFHRAIVEAAGELGLETRNEWMRVPTRAQRRLAHYGYEQFHALWAQQRHPEGLLIYPDVAASGVIMAILERHVCVPGELKLVLHANDLLPYLCPLPATFLVTEIGRFADALIEIVNSQFEDREARPQVWPPSVIPGPLPFSSDHGLSFEQFS